MLLVMDLPRNYRAAHDYVRKVKGPPWDYPCAHNCGKPANQWALVPKSIESVFVGPGKPWPWSTNPEDYSPLCLQCHRKHDDQKKRPLSEYPREAASGSSRG